MKIFVSRSFPGTAIDTLKSSGHEVVISPFDRPLTAEELLVHAKGVDGLLSFLTDKIDAEVLDAIGPQLKVVSNYAVGFDNIVVPAATERGIIVSNTPCDEVNEAVAEHTWALLLSLARRVTEADEVTKKGAYHGWEPGIFLGVNLHGRTLGIVGLGRIGEMVARRAKGFDMTVLYNKRTPDPKAEGELGVKFADLDTLLSQSDFVSLHAPLTDETRHMMNHDRFSKMKDRSYFVNTARGAMVDEYALVEALRSGKLAGAALDVFDAEPEVNPELVGMENVILTPHIASATLEARQKMGELAVSGILDTFNGHTPTAIVNPDVWDHRRV
jgi:glyoxylate reductase